jgi:hypothetical protein
VQEDNLPKNFGIAPGSSSEELANPGRVSRERVIQRWEDWRTRVHRLYADIEQALQNTLFRVERKSGPVSEEEFPRKVGVSPSQRQQVDSLRIVRPDGSSAATLTPRGLWVIGANGRVDLRITPPVAGGKIYMLIDESDPLSGPAHWIRVPIGAPFDREPFDPSWLANKLR